MKQIMLLWAVGLFFGGSSAWGENLFFGVMGDAGVVNRNTQMTRASMTRQNVRRLVLPGDNLYHSVRPYAQVWDRWGAEGFTFDVVAIGNHHLSYSAEMAYFKMPGEYYTLSDGRVRFVVLNSDNEKSARTQAEWLDRVLGTAQEKAIFVVFHHPFYTVSSFHAWREKAKFHQAVRPLLFKYRQKVTAFLLGHDHLSALVSMGGLPVFIVGAAHEQRQDQPVNYLEDGIRVQTVWQFKGEPSWAKLSVDSDTGISRIDFLDSRDDHLLCAVMLKSGQPPLGSLECQR